MNAWAAGVRFFSGAALNHAILLLGLGILLPIVLQVMLFGRPATMMNSAGAAADGTVAPAAILAVTVAGYVLQTGGFFASWRLGFGRGETLGGALIFGLLAGLMVCMGLGLVLLVLGIAFGLIAAPVALIVVLVAFAGLFAIVWTTFAALLAVAICLIFLLALGFGAAMGNLTFAATMVGGSGFVWSILIAASLVLLWLAGRLSCTTVLMAERKSLNLFGAMRESWNLTWDDEWRIMRYLALLGLVMALMMAGAFVAAGAGLVAGLRGGEAAGGIVTGVVFLALSMPLAYLAVLVPAGIYRELATVDAAAAEVFV